MLYYLPGVSHPHRSFARIPPLGPVAQAGGKDGKSSWRLE